VGLKELGALGAPAPMSSQALATPEAPGAIGAADPITDMGDDTQESTWG